MKRYLLIAVIVLVTAVPLRAQEETLISGDLESGGFGGPVLKIGPMKGTTGVLVGGRGGWIINHTFILGGGGYGLANNIRMTDPDGLNRTMYLEFGYGGVELDYIGNSSDVIHYTVGALIGGGSLGYRNAQGGMWDSNKQDAVFVLEPNVNLELNVTKFFRINAGVNYRWVNDVQFVGLSDKDLSGVAGSITLKFGAF